MSDGSPGLQMNTLSGGRCAFATSRVRRACRVVGVAFALLAPSACVIQAGVSPSAGAGGGIAVAGPPPAPIVDPRPGPPEGAVVWVAGYWHWTGMRYTWIPGHWAHAPAGAAWRPPRYWTADGTYYYEPGGWGRER
jgi:hypothetical protein